MTLDGNFAKDSMEKVEYVNRVGYFISHKGQKLQVFGHCFLTFRVLECSRFHEGLIVVLNGERGADNGDIEHN